MNERQHKVEEIFQAAVELGSPERQQAYLERACGHDADLRGEIEELLRAATAAEAIFQTRKPSDFCSDPASAEHGLAQVGSFIGRYKLLQRIGEGGCGVVYMAEQSEPVHRRVALKVIKLGMDTKSVVARFEAERQALALMDHPNIAKVLDAGATATGRPYFVMELVRGVKITDYCDENKVPTHERLELFMQVCQAVQHAHQKGIIHRDLKPSNILVTINDGRPVPKVIDFGIAKAIEGRLTDKTLFTAFEQFLGTPAYTSPEQAVMTSLDIDTRSDIYSLGVLLYELLTGKTPFDSAALLASGLNEMRRTICEKEPVRPSTRLRTMSDDDLTTTSKRRCTDPPRLVHLITGDLDWIVMKCLEKDRARRYATANGLTADIQRHLNEEPVVARPPSTAYRVEKFVRRNKRMVLAVAIIAIVLVLGILASTWQAIRATQAEREQSRLRQSAQKAQVEAKDEAARAERERNIARESAYGANMLLAQAAWEGNDIHRLHDLLALTKTHEERGFEWYYWQRQCHPGLTLYGHLDTVTSVAFSPDGQQIVTGSWDRTAKLWASDTGRELHTFSGHKHRVLSVAFSPDGHRIVTGSVDKTAKVWDPATGRELFELKGHDSEISSVTYSPDGRWILTGSSDSTAKLWDAKSGHELLTLRGHKGPIRSAAFSPDGKRIATAGVDRTAKIWEASSGQELLTLNGHTETIWAITWSPDGRLIVTGSEDRTAKVWEADTGHELVTLRGHARYIPALAFSPDGQKLVTGSDDSTAKIWDSTSWRELFILKGQANGISSVSFSPDGRRLVTGSYYRTATIWDLKSEPILPVTRGGSEGVKCLAFSFKGKPAMAISDGNRVQVAEVSNSQRSVTLAGHSGDVRAIAFSVDGQRIVTGSEDHTAKVWQADTGKELVTLRGHKGWVGAVGFSPDGRWIATGSRDTTARIWEASTGRQLRELKGHLGGVTSVDFSSDGQRIVTASGDYVAKVWDANTARELRALKGHLGPIICAAFSPDSRRIVTGSWDNSARVWEIDAESEPLKLSGQDEVLSVGFSPDGQRIVTGGADHTAKVWQTTTGRDLLTLKEFGAAVIAVAFSPDGQQIIAGSSDNQVKLWSRASEQEVDAWLGAEQVLELRSAAQTREWALAEERERTARAGEGGAVRKWLVLAPIPVQTTNLLMTLEQNQLADEAQLRPRAGDDATVAGRHLVWDEVQLADYVIDFNQLVGNMTDHSVAYAVSYLVADHAQAGLRMLIGSDDAAEVYLNGKLVYEYPHSREFRLDESEASGIELNQGLNVLVFKVVNETWDWQGSIRLTDNQGNPVKGIQVTLTSDGI